VTALRIGIDVGATTAGAAAVDRHGRLLAKARTPATTDLGADVTVLVRALIAYAAVEPARVTRVMLSTPHARDALTRRRGLRRVATIRIGAPLTHAIPPLATWPADLREAVSVGTAVVRGGAEYDGRSVMALDTDAIARFLEPLADQAESVAVTSVFAPVAADHELQAADVARRVLGWGVHVSMSHDLGTIGLLERENATVLNATLAGVAGRVGDAVEGVLTAHGIDADLFLAQNDGTLVAIDRALDFGVLVVGSGPATSMRGAAHLSGVTDAVVVDAGGTSTGVGAVVHASPREGTGPVHIAGVRVGFPMVEVLRLALGGGSLIDLAATPLVVGPRSVASAFGRDALVFGGATPTLADAAVATGRAQYGSGALVTSRRDELAPALDVLDEALAGAIGWATDTTVPGPLLAVGGASDLIPDSLPGVYEVIRPRNGEIAGAIGAAMAPVSAQAERICSNRPDVVLAALDDARAVARARAIHAGADPDTVEIVQLDEIPLTNLVDPAIRIRVKAAGPPG
jgi:N-methylhydantoinase A/oxoprolinase/acetone carboxylase beta subunit